MNSLSPIMAASRRRFGAAAYRAAVLADSPQAYWRLGETSGTTAVDEIGIYNGTYVGSPTLGVAGIFSGNSAVNFIGGSRRVTNATAGNFTSSPFTLEFWINAVSFGSSLDPSSSVPMFKGDYQVRGYYVILTASGTVEFVTSQAGANQVTISSTGSISTGSWYHVAITRAGAVAKTYVNGVDVTSSAATHVNPASSAQAFTIGTYGTLTYTPNAAIDEVAIYTTALSAARILAHYNAAGY